MTQNNELFEELFNNWVTLVEQDLAAGEWVNKDTQDLYERVCEFLKYEIVVCND